MAISFLNNITLNNNEVQNVKLHNTSTAPNAAPGQIYFDTSDGLAKYYSNPTDTWIDLKEYSFSDGTYIDVTTTGTTAKPVFTLDISAVDGTASAGERYLTKNNTWAEVAAIPGTYTWTVAGDTGSEAVPSGDTITFVGGTNISTSYNSTSNQLTISASGVMTGFTVAGDNGTNQTISNGDTLTISGGPVIVTTGAATDELIVKHDVVSRTDTTSTASPTYGGTLTVVDSVTSSSEGHVTAINVKTVTLPSSDDTTYDLTVQAGGANTSVIRLEGSDATNDDVTISGTSTTVKVTESGNTITLDLQDDVTIVNDLTVGGDINVTGSLNSYTTSELLVQDQYITLNSGQTSPVLDAFVKVERGTTDVAIKWNETTDRWQFTNDGSTYYNIPISSEYDNFNFSVEVGSSTQEVADGGVLTFAQGGGLTVGMSGDDTITYSHADTSSQSSVNNSGRTYIQDITLDTYGHITGITSATETVTNTDTQLATAAALIDVSAMGSNTTASFTHGLASKNLIVQMYDVTTGEVVFADIDHTSNNAISIVFASTPSSDIRVVVIDAKNGLTDKTVSYS